MSSLRTVVTSTAMVAVVGIGCVMWSIIAPGEDERIKSLPESNQTKMDEARKRNALMMQVLKEAANTDENILRRFEGPGK